MALFQLRLQSGLNRSPPSIRPSARGAKHSEKKGKRALPLQTPDYFLQIKAVDKVRNGCAAATGLPPPIAQSFKLSRLADKPTSRHFQESTHELRRNVSHKVSGFAHR